ncbi:MAG TPA: universal stress protein [Acidimicrobiia bacterium]|nr:universal stress protein [Acidimicrobiia bacterium]
MTSVYRHLLVGTDGSETATAAVKQAATLAAAFGARLTVMTVFSDVPDHELAEAGDQLPSEMRWQITGAAQAEETAQQGARVAKALGADAHARVERGQPAEAIIKALDVGDFDLVVVGSRGLSSPSRFLLGNVPNAVSHHAPCDVAVIHTA